ncbi:MAG: DUF2807 domain-containing protein [Chitinophagales bacterium]|jgi:hypothetical protein|nr:DUF2807 domain-containing protein [Chitinophagales bacterium]
MNTVLSAGNYPQVATLNIPVESFDAIRVEKGITVILQQGDIPGVNVADHKDANAINIRCKGAQLRISKKMFRKQTTVYVTCSELTKIRACYGAQVIANDLSGEQLELIVDENAVVYIKADVDLIKSTNRNGLINITGDYHVEKGLYDYNGRYSVIYTHTKPNLTESIK